jgi:hypothetical protein
MGCTAGTHCVPHLLAAGTHAGAVYRNALGRTRGQKDRTSTPLVRALALHGVSATETFGVEATWAQPLSRGELS